MTSKDVEDRFKTLQIDNSLKCTQDEFNDFVNCGLLIASGKNYMTRNGKLVNVDILKSTVRKFNLDLSGIVSNAKKILEGSNTNKLYLMSAKTFNMYKLQGLIYEIDNKCYYKLYDKELWLTMII